MACALEEAERHGVSISIAVVNAEEAVVLTAHMDEAPSLSRAIALNKAVTAGAFRSSTAEWPARLERCSPVVRQGLPLQAGVALFGGGEPFVYKAIVIGAIGISGASEAIDVACARAARSQVEALLARD
jgi:uncharacterized protein GlcG (DUF336 family)